MPPVDAYGVPLDVYGNWPGIDSPGHVRVDRTQLRALARRLEHHLDEILSAHEDLKPAAPGAYGHWDAAQDFYGSVKEGHETLLDQHSRFLHAVMDMIKKLHRSAQMYDEAEAELERRIAEVDKHLNVQTTSERGDFGSSRGHPAKPPAANALNPDRRS